MEQKKKKRISCIIPAHNEEKGIFNTLQAVMEAGDCIDEILVIDDGSTDRTRDIVLTFPSVRLLVNEKNRGKSHAVARGIMESSGDHILLLDADLIGLNAIAIASLVTPVTNGVAEASISMRENTPVWMKMLGIDFMSGERVFPREFLAPHCEKMGHLHFGIEVFLNRLMIEHGLTIKTVMMQNVKNDKKWNKHGFRSGIIGEIRMWRDILKTVSVKELISQNIAMRKMLVKDHAGRTKKFNSEYFNLVKELYLLFRLELSQKRHGGNANGRILIVTPCLMGEFAASIPAIGDFISRNKTKEIDLMVSPSLKPLAEKIKGIGRVFSVSSVYGRDGGGIRKDTSPSGRYERIIVLRTSDDAHRIIRHTDARKIETSAQYIARYVLHLSWSLIQRRTPKRWSEMNFEMLGSIPRTVPFDDLFHFENRDYAFLDAVPALRTGKKKIVVHAGSRWPMKSWEVKKWIALLKKLHTSYECGFIFVGTKEDGEEYRDISSGLDFAVHSLIGKMDTAQLLLLLRSSDYFIGVDSGPRNMAHLAGLRSVTILGPGPHMYMPPDRRDVIVDRSNGRGLYQMFFRKKNGFIHAISADAVFEAFRTLVRRNTGDRTAIR